MNLKGFINICISLKLFIHNRFYTVNATNMLILCVSVSFQSYMNVCVLEIYFICRYLYKYLGILMRLCWTTIMRDIGHF